MIPLERDELCVEDPESIVKSMLRLEAAHWHYIDNVQPAHRELPHLSIQSFVAVYLPHLSSQELNEIVRLFNRYKKSLQIYGSILLSPNYEQVLLVKNINSDSWSFPKGKQELGESDIETVVRETLEETNINVAAYLSPEKTLKHRRATFFIVENIPLDILAVPWKRTEISQISWFQVSELDSRPIFNIYIRHLVGKLNHWIRTQKGQTFIT